MVSVLGVSADLITTLVLNGASAVLILALAALGLVVIFGLMGVINLAHGAFITLGAYVAWASATVLGIGFWPGLVLAPLVVGLVGLIVERTVVRFLYDRLLGSILATWGIALIIQELIKLAVGDTAKQVANPLSARVDLGVTTYPAYRLFLIVFGTVTLALVFLMFSRTRLGVRLRAVIQDQKAASLLGLDQERTYQFAFAFGAGLAGLAGAAVAPVFSVAPDIGTSYLVESFLAVILGGTGVLVGVIPGSIVVGGFSNLLTFPLDPVVARTLVYVLAVAVILVRPAGILGTLRAEGTAASNNETSSQGAAARAGRADSLEIPLLGDRPSLSAPRVGGVALLLAAVVAPFVMDAFFVNDLLRKAFVFCIFAISVDLLWGYGGVLSFGHAAFFGLGTYVAAKAVDAFGVAGGDVVIILLSAVVPGLVGLVVGGVLFYRGIRDDYFTIITLAVAIIAEQIAVSWQSVTGGFNGIAGIRALDLGIPAVFEIPLSGLNLYYFMILGVLAIYLFGRRMVRSPFGQSLVAIQQNETKARALGYNVRRYKTLVFAISTALAGLAGGLYAAHASFVSPSLLGFLLSTEVLIWVLVGGRGTLTGPIVGTVFLVVFESSLSGAFVFSWTLLLGLALVVIVLIFPGGMVAALGIATARLTDWLGSRTA